MKNFRSDIRHSTKILNQLRWEPGLQPRIKRTKSDTPKPGLKPRLQVRILPVNRPLFPAHCSLFTFILFTIPCSLFTLFASPALSAEQSITVADINFGVVGEQEFIAGGAVLPRRPVAWESDVPWIITVESLDPNLGASDDGSYLKPLGDLEWKLSDDKRWKKMRQDPEIVLSGVESGQGTILLDWRVMLFWTKDLPGQYRATLRFTIAEN